MKTNRGQDNPCPHNERCAKMATPTNKKLYKINTFDYGVFYRWAKSAPAARQRIVYEIFGKGYDGYDHEYWEITEEPPKPKATTAA